MIFIFLLNFQLVVFNGQIETEDVFDQIQNENGFSSNLDEIQLRNSCNLICEYDHEWVEMVRFKAIKSLPCFTFLLIQFNSIQFSEVSLANFMSSINIFMKTLSANFGPV